jgi:hypothetical protein
MERWIFIRKKGYLVDDEENQARSQNHFGSNHFVPGAGSYGSGVRAQVFEVIVRQAIAGAPWREICLGPMQVNSITPEEIETEVNRRRGGDGSADASVVKKPKPSSGAGEISLPLP